MARIPDRDRDFIFDTVGMNSSRFTAYELKVIHRIALILDKIGAAIRAREDRWWH